MRINKYGFSLVELLITIGIVSVVAAMIIPSLKDKTSTKSFLPKSEKIAGSIQSGIMDVMSTAYSNLDMSQGVPESLSEIRVSDFEGTKYGESIKGTSKIQKNKTMYDRMREDGGTNFFQSIASALDLVPFSDDDTYKAQDVVEEAISSDVSYYKTKRGDAYVIIETVQANSNPEDNSTALARIAIDVNGNKAPNTIYNANDNPKGDIFLYGLGNNGNMYKEGTEAYNNHVWSDGPKLIRNGRPDDRFFHRPF